MSENIKNKKIKKLEEKINELENKLNEVEETVRLNHILIVQNIPLHKKRH